MPAPPGPRPLGAANGRVFASPLARKIAKDHGLAIEEITGTGPRGGSSRRDVDAAVESRSDGFETVVERPPQPPAGGAAYEEIPHSRIRLATARRLTESKQQAPHFYLRATVRAEALLALRATLNRDDSVRVSINDLVPRGAPRDHLPALPRRLRPAAGLRPLSGDDRRHGAGGERLRLRQHVLRGQAQAASAVLLATASLVLTASLWLAILGGVG